MKDLESKKVNESTSPDCGKPVVSGSFICAFTGMPAHYRIGVIKYKSKRIYKEVGAVVTDKVLEAIDKTQTACFATKFWPVVMDLDGKVIYRSDLADIDKLTAQEGWRMFVAENLR